MQIIKLNLPLSVMYRMKLKIKFLVVSLFLNSVIAYSIPRTSDPVLKHEFKIKDLSLISKKKGIYIGYERGLYDVVGFGGELQRKKMAIKGAKIDAFSLGFNYNFKNNILGYDFSYWHKDGIIGLTYGADVVAISDFKAFNFGVSPTIGFRFSGFHLQTGYKFMAKKSGLNSNNLFIRLRFTIHKSTERDLKTHK